MELPAEFISKVHRMFGDQGRVWLPRLPDIAAQCRARWHLQPGEMCATMSMNYIEFCTMPDGRQVALKIGVPHRDLFTEMEALELYAGRTAARFVASDQDLGAILMQRIRPGHVLWRLRDNAAETRIAAGIMQQLFTPPPAEHGFPAFGEWVERAFRLTRDEWDPEGRMPRDLIDQAERAFSRILASGGPAVVLHGDLHHENILLDESDGWLAVDPKGVTGPTCLEVGRYMRNQLPAHLSDADLVRLMADRIRIFSEELGMPAETVAASSLVDGVLGHCWGLEEEELGPGWHDGLRSLRLLSEMAP